MNIRWRVANDDNAITGQIESEYFHCALPGNTRKFGAMFVIGAKCADVKPTGVDTNGGQFASRTIGNVAGQ